MLFLSIRTIVRAVLMKGWLVTGEMIRQLIEAILPQRRIDRFANELGSLPAHIAPQRVAELYGARHELTSVELNSAAYRLNEADAERALSFKTLLSIAEIAAVLTDRVAGLNKMPTPPNKMGPVPITDTPCPHRVAEQLAGSATRIARALESHVAKQQEGRIPKTARVEWDLLAELLDTRGARRPLRAPTALRSVGGMP